MNRYESYKEVNLPWLKEVPSHWEVRRNKNIFFNKKEIVGDKFEKIELLSLTTKGIKVKKLYEAGGKKPRSYSTYQYVKTNELVLCLFDLDCSAVFSDMSNYNGMISPTYDVFDIKNTQIFCAKFYKYLFDFLFQNRTYKIYSKNLRYTVTVDNFLSLENIIPPISEQQKIVAFLDWKITEIDKLIAKEKEKIRELEEFKKTIITKVVTEGIEKNKEKTTYNIDWIKKTPKDWEIIKLKFLGNAKNGITYEPKDLSDNGIIVLRSSNIQKEKLDLKDTVYLKSNIRQDMFLKKDDILICSRNGSRNLVGKNLLIEEDNKYTFGAFMCRFRSKYNKYLYWVFNSEMFDYYMKLFTTSTINQLTNGNLYSMYVPLPTDEEQEKIKRYLTRKRIQINDFIIKTNQQIQNLESLKQSLILEVVTGQIDVRDVVVPKYEKFTLENDNDLVEEVEENE